MPAEPEAGSRLIDGRSFAAALHARVAAATAELAERHGLRPGLAVVLVGDDPASRVYVRSKQHRAADAGIASYEHRLPADTAPAALLDLVARLNTDAGVHGILVQLPLPPGFDAAAVAEAIAPARDVDGLHPLNAGLLAGGRRDRALVPCTPLGVRLLLDDRLGALTGLEAVIVGRSGLVGRPLAQLLLEADATVTLAHSRTRDLPALCRRADVLVAAAGRPQMIRGDWIRDGACVVDVGINRIAAPTADDPGATRLVGDVAFDEAWPRAGAITPVPGGVGPMTVACLLANTVTAACRQTGVAVPGTLAGLA